MKSSLDGGQGGAAPLAQVPGGPVWALVGPTACGKSAVAQAVALAVGGEVVGCDSVQVYRGFDLGSAKPGSAARAAVPHHLVDCCDAGVNFDAMAYVRAARTALADIRGRGKVPIICGGTGLYLRALAQGLVQVPSDPALRARLDRAMAENPAACYAQLVALDPAGAAKISPNNPAYVVRALEICLVSHRPASVVRAEHAARAAAGGDGVALVVVALDGPSPWLRAQIEARTAKMLAAGLLQEVRALLASGVPSGAAPLRSVGYREAAAVLAGALPEAELGPAINKATWSYARRQRTWLRRAPPHATVDATLAPESRLAEVLRAWRSAGAPGV